jgi:hypothetical protein
MTVDFSIDNVNFDTLLQEGSLDFQTMLRFGWFDVCIPWL